MSLTVSFVKGQPNEIICIICDKKWLYQTPSWRTNWTFPVNKKFAQVPLLFESNLHISGGRPIQPQRYWYKNYIREDQASPNSQPLPPCLTCYKRQRWSSTGTRRVSKSCSVEHFDNYFSDCLLACFDFLLDAFCSSSQHNRSNVCQVVGPLQHWLSVKIQNYQPSLTLLAPSVVDIKNSKSIADPHFCDWFSKHDSAASKANLNIFRNNICTLLRKKWPNLKL